MLKPTVKRGLMLDFIPEGISCPAIVNEHRVHKLNDKKIGKGDIIYIMSRELRLEDNWALLFGLSLAKQHNRKFKIIVQPLPYSKVQKPFVEDGLNFLTKNSALNGIDLCISDKIPQNAGALIFDFNPIELVNVNSFTPSFTNKFATFEVDSHNIIPARYVSDKQEFSAATLRRKIYANIAGFLTEYPIMFKIEKTPAINKLEDFIQNKLDYYAEFKNNPINDVTSGLSPYMHFGFISSLRIALEIIKSNASRENKEAFLEELIVRKELSDNFCLYSSDFKSFQSVPNWANDTLNAHLNDFRLYIYSPEQFEKAKTHDELWNKVQQNLLDTGRIHGYLRMYWAKKILEWSASPQEAIKTAIYLNDEYALDGCDPNGYVGILWSLGGLHDRAFSQRPVFGKIRYMSLNGLKKIFDVKSYINR